MDRKLTSGLIVLALLGVSGCGQAEPKPLEKLVPVAGKVVFDGKPVAGIQVNFVPVKDNTKSHGGRGVTDAEGKFEMKNYMNLDGIPEGQYAVTFSWMRMADGSAPPKDAKPIPMIGPMEKFPRSGMT